MGLSGHTLTVTLELQPPTFGTAKVLALLPWFLVPRRGPSRVGLSKPNEDTRDVSVRVETGRGRRATSAVISGDTYGLKPVSTNSRIILLSIFLTGRAGGTNMVGFLMRAIHLLGRRWHGPARASKDLFGGD